MSAVLLLLALFIPTYAIATPPNSTEKVTWTPEPRGRGTWGILSNCIFTLIICIWRVIHDDVKIEKTLSLSQGPIIIDPTPFSRLLSKLQWMLYAFLVPEAVIMSALKQNTEAGDLQREFCSIIGVEPGSKDDILGLEGSFFVIMGGFSYAPLRPDGSYPGILDKENFIRLVKEKGVPDSVNLRQIRDRGKADAIGKLLALTQALSMVVQCLLRNIHGLTVTLLEFHVVIQVLCTVLIYALWWSKPQGVLEPIPFEQPATQFDKIPTSGEVIVPSRSPTAPDIAGVLRAAPDIITMQGYLLALRLEQRMNTAPIPPRETRTAASGNSVHTSQIIQRPASMSLFSQFTVEEIRDRLKEWYMVPFISNFSTLHLFTYHNVPAVELAEGLKLYPIYGALHGLGWILGSFPTRIEQTLWAISCLSLIHIPLSFMIYHIALLASRRTPGRYDCIARMLVIFDLLICRSYLMIECFISLRLLPADAYLTVVWESVWPHL